ncbi:MAG TPA: hypothetical protein EYP62_02230 [Kiritimatiellae bacterium]|nr:hypothetical protein [Kiritimatiellia bacterium]
MAKARASGLWVGRKRACVAVAERSDGDIRRLGAESVELPEPEEGARGKGRQDRLRALCSRRGGALVWVMAAREVLVRVLELPAVDEAELSAMAELQLDKLSPLPPERLYWDFEVVHHGGDRLRILLASVERGRVDEAGDFFRGLSAGLWRVDCESLALWEWLRGEKIDEGSRKAWLLLHEKEGRRMLLLAADRYGPLEFRVIEMPEGELTPEDVAGEAGREIAYTLAALEAQWGAPAAVRIEVVFDGEEPAWCRRLGDVLELPVERRQADLAVEIAAGAALRALRVERAINLAPAEWEQTVRYRRTRRRVVTAAVAVVILWLGLMGGMAAVSQIQRTRLEAVLRREQTMARPAAELRELRRKVRGLESYADRSHSVLEALREVVSLMPGGVDLTAFAYKKGRGVQLRGTAERTEPIYEFFAALEKSDFFSSVKPEGVTTRRRGRQVVSEFKVRCLLGGGGK